MIKIYIIKMKIETAATPTKENIVSQELKDYIEIQICYEIDRQHRKNLRETTNSLKDQVAEALTFTFKGMV